MPLSGQWADSLLELERLHLLRYLIWAAVSILVGTGMLAARRAVRQSSAVSGGLAAQCIAWGVVNLGRAMWAHQGLALRDLGGAVALDRTIWFTIGLDVGAVALGGALVLVGRQPAARPALLGAGLGVLIQGLALGVLDLQLAAAIVR